MLRGRRSDQDRDELSRLYREQVRSVYAFFGYALPPALAEDLTAATFERVVRAWSSYDPSRGGERTWVMAIARNQLADHFRRGHERWVVSSHADPEAASVLGAPDPSLERALDADELRGWLRHLDEREREVVALRYGADLPGTEVARLLGLSPANVHQIASRSLRRLQRAADAGQLSGSG